MIKLRDFLTSLPNDVKADIWTEQRFNDEESVFLGDKLNALRWAINNDFDEYGDEVPQNVWYVQSVFFLESARLKIWVCDDMAAKENTDFFDKYYSGLKRNGRLNDVERFFK